MNKRNTFVLKNGIIKFGIPAGIMMCLLYELLNVKFELSLIDLANIFTIHSLIFICLFIIGGIVWGNVMWKFSKQNER